MSNGNVGFDLQSGVAPLPNTVRDRPKGSGTVKFPRKFVERPTVVATVQCITSGGTYIDYILTIGKVSTESFTFSVTAVPPDGPPINQADTGVHWVAVVQRR